MKKIVLKSIFSTLACFILCISVNAQNETEKKILFKIFLAGELNYTIEDATTIDNAFNKATFIYGCKTNIETKIIELHATDGLNRTAIIDFLSYTGKGYKVSRIDQFEE